jgi:dTMP kinase
MGIFITFEGIDGSGKTTVSKILKARLEKDGYKAMLIKEPTETPLGKFIRGEILGSGSAGAEDALTALFLFSADRTVHIDEIKAKLNCLDVIICDRFIDSTYAYQTAGFNDTGENKKLKDFILGVNEFILEQKEFSIDRTYLFDLKPETALSRLNGRADKIDGFDSRPPEFFNSVRNNYLRLSEKYKERIKIIDASAPPENTAKKIEADILKMLEKRKP